MASGLAAAAYAVNVVDPPPLDLTPVPLYAVLFHADDSGSEYSPFLTRPQETRAHSTVPHGLDREVAAALPGLWYCLHLPSTLFELIDYPARTIKTMQALETGPLIFLAPMDHFQSDNLDSWAGSGVVRALAVAPDDLVDEAQTRAEALGFALPSIGYSGLSNNSLRGHWQEIHAAFAKRYDYLGREPTLKERLDLAPIQLPTAFLARQFALIASESSTPEDALEVAMMYQAFLQAIVTLEEEELTPREAESRLDEAVAKARLRLRLPATLANCGVPSRYSRRALAPLLRREIEHLPQVDSQDTWPISLPAKTDGRIERAAIEFVVAHRSIGKGAPGLMGGTISQEAFTILAQLEHHWRAGPRGWKVWRMLQRLDEATEQLWSASVTELLLRSSSLTVISNFPVGLLKMPGDTAPLACKIPLTYRPALPLTRTLQAELRPAPLVDLMGGFRVLVAECIPTSDLVGALSRIGWGATVEAVQSSGGPVSIEQVETLSVGALRAALIDHSPDILVVSAHGVFSQATNVAGVLIGEEPWLGQDIGRLPPVVLLSACSANPLGMGAVSVADLLLREGVMAVLATQVPVDVRRNATLMMRLFLYMSEVLVGREPHSSLLEVWHRVQASNVINDVLSGSEAIHAWGMDRPKVGSSVLEEFMNVRATGRLRLAHIYQDTELLLVEIGEERGVGDRVRSWLRTPGYVPESLFYAFFGRPDRVYLRPPSTALGAAWKKMKEANR